MPIGTYDDYTPPNSARPYTVPIGASSSHGPENFQYFVDALENQLSSALINEQTAATYQFVRADAGRLTMFNRATAVTATVPAYATTDFPYYDPPDVLNAPVIPMLNVNAGVVTVVGAGGVTVTGDDLTLAQNERGMLISRGLNSWLMVKSGGGAIPFALLGSGGTVTTYSVGPIDYEVRAFLSTASIVVDETGTADALVVGGGGGGGKYGSTYTHGGGGGGGGVREVFDILLTAGTHTVTVGAGGAGNADGCGSPSSIGTIVIAPGGGNGGGGYSQGGNGGSGSGAMPAYNGNANGKAVCGTTVGHDGGTSNSYDAAGGGGGWGAVGGNGATTVGGNGGAGGASTLYDNTTRYYAGGGGGGGDVTAGTGGTGGGGAGATTGGNPVAGTANTGGGGGGCDTGTAANGGSGVVYIRVRTN